jgi:hypothetical protein
MTTRGSQLRAAAVKGMAAGLTGAAVMAVTEKAEQAVTHRPDSYVPARALMSLLGRSPSDHEKPPGWNHAMHYGTAAVVGTLRGLWSVTGIRGPQASAWHTVVRLAVDQTIENTTGVGAPPSTWATQERVVDVLHKGVYSFVTGAVTDLWIRPTLESRRGIRSH